MIINLLVRHPLLYAYIHRKTPSKRVLSNEVINFVSQYFFSVERIVFDIIWYNLVIGWCKKFEVRMQINNSELLWTITRLIAVLSVTGNWNSTIRFMVKFIMSLFSCFRFYDSASINISSKLISPVNAEVNACNYLY